MTLGIIKTSGCVKPQMHLRTSFNSLFFQRPAVNESSFKTMLSHMYVVLHLPAFSQFPQLLFLLSGSQASGILFRTSPLGIPGVIAPEILFRCTFYAIIHTLTHHDMRMRLFASVNACFRIVNGKTPCMPFAGFLTYKILHQFKALFRCQFTGQRDFQFPISRTVRTFKLVSRLPEMGRIIHGPFRHVPVLREL
ncbi:Uncharacterised protein [Escherichia coli]|nr:Uncharacterised protein [Escherichia coli]